MTFEPCQWCGMIHGSARCPAVSAMELHPDGSVKRVEFFPIEMNGCKIMRSIIEPEMPLQATSVSVATAGEGADRRIIVNLKDEQDRPIALAGFTLVNALEFARQFCEVVDEEQHGSMFGEMEAEPEQKPN